MKPLRLATYNIHKGKGMDRRTSVDRIGRVLEELDADIVALQETTADQAHRLGEALGFHVANPVGVVSTFVLWWAIIVSVWLALRRLFHDKQV